MKKRKMINKVKIKIEKKKKVINLKYKELKWLNKETQKRHKKKLCSTKSDLKNLNKSKV